MAPSTPSPAFLHTVSEITTIYRSLPLRPSIEQVEAAMSTVETVDKEEQMKLQELSMQEEPEGVSEELFSVLQELKKTVVLFQSHEQKREALHLLELEKMFKTSGDLIQRASELVSGDIQSQKRINFTEPGDGSSEKLSLMKVATIIESCLNSGAAILELRGKLMDQVEWLPVSIGKLSDVSELDLSENRIMALPSTIGGLKALRKLDLHSNQLINLPSSVGELINLTDLDLHANRLKSLPESFGNLKNLIDLDLSSNEFTLLPEIIGNLTSLQRFIVATNELEELPYTIGNCISLSELRLDFNQIKALPEGIGELECLEILTLHYNRIKKLPTTMGNLSHLKELDVSFNELEFVPENLCFAVSLKKLNVGNNFADLTALPRSIGNLEMLEELDISDDQIKALPESFRFLSKLKVFRADETPLELPPREVIKLGAQAVVQYMADFVVNPEAKFHQPSKKKKKKKGLWLWFCSIFCSTRR